jgi:hypothetical protein
MAHVSYRDRGWQSEDDPWYDLDHHLAFRYPGHLGGGDDCQGGSAAVVSAQDCSLQERQCAELPSQVGYLANVDMNFN